MATILIVDDEEGFRHILQIILQRGGYTTITANDAQQAQTLIEQQPPDVLILDDMMPGMTGSELCVSLKADSRYRHIPVIMHSANSKFHDKSYIATIGADDVLLKPCSPRDIVNVISRFA